MQLGRWRAGRAGAVQTGHGDRSGRAPPGQPGPPPAPSSQAPGQAARYDGWPHTPGPTFAAQQDRLTAQFTRECDTITAAQREGRITSAEAAGMTEAAHKRPDTAMALTQIGRDHPRWHCWVGVGGILYARIPMSSPPVVVRAPTVSELRTLVTSKEAGLRP